MSETGEVELRIDQVAPETTAGVDGDLDQCLDHATYDEPFVVDEPGEYTIEYGSIDVAGNIEQWQEVTFTIDLGPCPHPDERETVVIGGLDSGVPNHVLENGCTINDLVLDDQPWDSVGDFVRHIRGVADELVADGVISRREAGQLTATAAQSGVGRPSGGTV